MATELDLDAIEARLAKTTPAPWCFYNEDLWRGTAAQLEAFDADPENVPWPFDGDDESGHLFYGDPVNPADAEFIAHARQDVPALIDRIRAFEATVDAVERIVAQAQHPALRRQTLAEDVDLIWRGRTQARKACEDWKSARDTAVTRAEAAEQALERVRALCHAQGEDSYVMVHALRRALTPQGGSDG